MKTEEGQGQKREKSDTSMDQCLFLFKLVIREKNRCFPRLVSIFVLESKRAPGKCQPN